MTNKHPSSFEVPPITEMGMLCFVISIFIFFVLPIPPWALEGSITLIWAISFIFLTLSLSQPALHKISSYPAYLLITSFFRLGVLFQVTRYWAEYGGQNTYTDIQPLIISTYAAGWHGGYSALFALALLAGCMVALFGVQCFLRCSRPDKDALDFRTHRGLEGVLIVLGLELLLTVGLVALFGLADIEIHPELNTGSISFRPLLHNGEFVLNQAREPLYCLLMIGVVVEILPILMMTLGIGILGNPNPERETGLGHSLFVQTQHYPYALLFAGTFIMFLALTAPMTGFFPFLPCFMISLILFGVASMVFLSRDITAQME